MRYGFCSIIQKVEQEGIPQPDLLSLIQWERQSERLKKISNLWKVLDPDSLYAPIGWPFIGATPLHALAALGSKSAVDEFMREGDAEVDGRDTEEIHHYFSLSGSATMILL